MSKLKLHTTILTIGLTAGLGSLAAQNQTPKLTPTDQNAQRPVNPDAMQKSTPEATTGANTATDTTPTRVTTSGQATTETPRTTTTDQMNSDQPRSAASSMQTEQSRNRMGDGAKLSAKDQKFADEAAIGGMAEVQLAQMAQQKGQSDSVKSLAKMIESDHSKANDELKSLASQNNWTLPTDLDAKHKAVADRLSKLDGAAFDREYSKEMVSDHKKDISDFQKQASGGSNPALKDFASKTVPALQEHLKMAQSAQTGKSGSMSGMSSSTPSTTSTSTPSNTMPSTTAPSTPTTSGTSTPRQ